MTKMRQNDLEKRLKEEESKLRSVLDYSQFSTDDDEVSDYELDAKDLHPRRHDRSEK